MIFDRPESKTFIFLIRNIALRGSTGTGIYMSFEFLTFNLQKLLVWETCQTEAPRSEVLVVTMYFCGYSLSSGKGISKSTVSLQISALNGTAFFCASLLATTPSYFFAQASNLWHSSGQNDAFLFKASILNCFPLYKESSM